MKDAGISARLAGRGGLRICLAVSLLAMHEGCIVYDVAETAVDVTTTAVDVAAGAVDLVVPDRDERRSD